MKRLVPLSLALAVLLGIALGTPTTTSAQGAGFVSSLLNRMERNRRDLKSLRASVDMVKYNSQIGDEDKYKGVVLYVPAAGRDAYVRVDWSSPQKETLAVSDGQFTLCRPRLNMCYKGNSKSTKAKPGAALEFMNMSRQQLASRYNLEYIGEDNKPHRPVMVHRALFGSIERFFGVLIEHYAGAFPLWLAPVQTIVLPITDRINEYAQEVGAQLRSAGLRVETNLRSEKIGAKIRNAQMQKIPFMLVLGDREMEQGNVAVRERATGDLGAMSVEEFKTMAHRLVESRALTNT